MLLISCIVNTSFLTFNSSETVSLMFATLLKPLGYFIHVVLFLEIAALSTCFYTYVSLSCFLFFSVLIHR